MRFRMTGPHRPQTYLRQGDRVWRVDPVEEGVQPRCPRCGIVMRDIAGGWICPACKYTSFAQLAQQPIDPDLPNIHGG